ncbi:MAG TPA: tyrosine--tRNA ligase [Candidatus Saccharimonadales bacterium]|nr:tyrosine--tRNA ligase [Candidatus Saccharimonadales bacterium]
MDELLTRGVEEIIPRDELQAALKAKRKLRLKLGVDPSSPDIHLGHAVVLRQLKAFQDLGHTVIFLIGDATARIGDPSGRNKTRPVLNQDQINHNAQTYLDQVSKILDVKKCEIRRNSEWLDELGFTKLVHLAGQFTVAQLVEREDFKNRLDAGIDLSLHELLYPVMQAYDSVVLEADVEFGGTDQRFNMLAGRALQKKLGQSPQQVFMSKLLVGSDGVQKMSKSLGNYIGLTDQPNDMYGKVMSIPDELIAEYYELCTDIDRDVIHELVKTLAAGANPRDAKASLAREIVRIYHGEAEALAAEAAFNTQFRDKQRPAVIDQFLVTGGDKTVVDILLKADLAASKTEARRLIAQGGVRVNDRVLEPDVNPRLANDDVVQVGKRRYIQVKF